ncbi:hypothetical protein [Caballeronia insecticola]|uniref:Uncharacterized protein n=1 Tax=Caballeronia insecticola TaxID=758793 RepID=A0A060PRV7_9BURK|nr:hypothetical protein [Caballeronia insecticola]BAO94175.1 hypothetical protein BRPE64_ECDS02930 [Caballeronia insecticola]
MKDTRKELIQRTLKRLALILVASAAYFAYMKARAETPQIRAGSVSMISGQPGSIWIR